jgi:hypothetical protein
MVYNYDSLTYALKWPIVRARRTLATMARVVGRARQREGRGIGERLAESVVYIIIIAIVAVAAHRYFFVYLKSPSAALLKYLGAAKAGDVNTQYSLITDSSKARFKNKDEYDDRFPLAHGLQGRMIDYKIEKMTELAEKAEADVTISIRKSGQELYQAGSDNTKDHYVLRKDSSGWKLALDASELKSAGFSSNR